MKKVILKKIYNGMTVVSDIISSKPTLIELSKIVSIIIIFAMFMLMVTHLLLVGEFGFIYWIYKSGWIWNR